MDAYSLNPPSTGSYSEKAAPEDVGQVLHAADAVGLETRGLHELIDALERNLEPVLTPVGPDTTADPGTHPSPPGSPLFHNLSAHARMLSVAGDRIRSLSLRLEV
jgi:hypothetical protein